MCEGGGSDNLCGRAATGLNINSIDFGALPPHFWTEDAAPLLTVQEWVELVPDFERYPDSFRQVLPFLLASVIYHREWLESNLHRDHPLFISRVWTMPGKTAGTTRFEELREHVYSGAMHNPKTGLTATGASTGCISSSPR